MDTGVIAVGGFEVLILKVKYVHSWQNEFVAVNEDSALLYWKDETAPRPL